MGEVMGHGAATGTPPYELLLGRGTYEIFAAHWPHVTDDPLADELNSVPKHVASRTLRAVKWSNSALITGDVPDYVRSLKAQDGPEIQVHGSAGLIQTLLAHDLIDVFRPWPSPSWSGAASACSETARFPPHSGCSTAGSRRPA